MNLGEYIEHLQDIAEAHGDHLKLCYAKDDEGSGWDPLVYAPSVGSFDGHEWTTEGEIIADGDQIKINAVCLN